ncbi:hypothetical protein ACROYT_G019404 [Oculina patagonica]
MHTFADWMRYYNNPDVSPDLEALEKMRAFYTENGIDILKDAVSIPVASLHYLLRGSSREGHRAVQPVITGDIDKSKALLADVLKLLENSAYGKLIEALERQTNIIYAKDEKAVAILTSLGERTSWKA